MDREKLQLALQDQGQREEMSCVDNAGTAAKLVG
jgi:hypothetical protein